MNIIRLVFLLLIAFGVFLVFQKPTLPEINTTGDAHNGFKLKMQKMIKADKEGGKLEADFTEEEVNSFATQVIDVENKGNVQLREIFVDLLDDNGVKLYFNTDVFGQRIVSSCVGKVAGGSGGLTFTPNGFFAARLGKLPYPMPLFKYMTKKVLDEKSELGEFLAIITSIEISDDKVKVKVGSE